MPLVQKRYPSVDVHAHICDAAFDSDRQAVLARAAETGVEIIVAVGENMADARTNLQLAQRHLCGSSCSGGF